MKLLHFELFGRYKGLADQRFDFQEAPGLIVAFIGMNGSGKSQLMELVAEAFVYLERMQRKDFRVRNGLEFGFELGFQWHDLATGGESRFIVTSQRRGAPTVTKSTTDPAISDAQPNWELDMPFPFEALPLPRLIGYASGLNENLQRPFMRNGVQYFDVMTVRSKRRAEISMPKVDERKFIEINHRYRARYPGIFGSVDELNSDDFGTDEADTRLPSGVFLDYDCTNLVVACLGLLSPSERDELWPEVPFRHPKETVLRYDIRKVPFEQDTIQDIEQLVRALGPECVRPRSARTRDRDLERYGLDYLSADLVLDLGDAGTVQRLRETYRQPATLFWKLYKLQLLGVKYWAADVKKSLRDDRFQGHVKKPLKGKLPLSVVKLEMSDGAQLASIDDLSDGEAQLLHTLGAVRLFGEEQALFIFDEPETHLNPNWRTRYHLDFERAEQGRGTSQALISSHSPFLISSLSRSAVLLFEKLHGVTTATSPADETFGASFEVLIKRFFDLKTSISQTAVDQIKQRLHNSNMSKMAQIDWIERHLGESVERVYLLKKLEE